MKVARVACCGVGAVDAILRKVHGIHVVKALDPNDPDDFLVIVNRLGTALSEASAGSEVAALRTALAALDVNWPALTAAQADRVIEAARESLAARITSAVMPSIAEEFELAGPEVMAAARAGAITRFGLQIETALALRDLDAERFIRSSYANMVTNAYGERVDAFASLARDIVAEGLEQGLGRDDIGDALTAAMGDRLVRNASYFQVVAAAFMNTARTASLLGSFSDAGIEKYRFEAVLDEATTDQCRFYHDQIFNVSDGVAAMNRAMQASTIEDLQEANPWVRVGNDADGSYMYISRNGEREVVARIDQSGVGTQQRGSYSGGMTTTQLASAGVPWPPLHGRCRSTIVPAGEGF